MSIENPLSLLRDKSQTQDGTVKFLRRLKESPRITSELIGVLAYNSQQAGQIDVYTEPISIGLLDFDSLVDMRILRAVKYDSRKEDDAPSVALTHLGKFVLKHAVFIENGDGTLPTINASALTEKLVDGFSS